MSFPQSTPVVLLTEKDPIVAFGWRWIWKPKVSQPLGRLSATLVLWRGSGPKHRTRPFSILNTRMERAER